MIQAEMDAIQTGLTIRSVSQKSYGPPGHLKYEFQAVNRAESQKALKIEEAKRLQSMILTQAAGRNYPIIIRAIHALEEGADGPQKNALTEKLRQYFLSDALGGMAAEIMNSAITYRTRTLENILSAVDRFNRLVKQDQENSQILRNRITQDCIEQIFSQEVKTIVIPKSERHHLYLDLGKDISRY